MDETPPKLTKLQALLLQGGKSHGEVAAAAKRHYTTVGRWANGEIYPARDAAKRLVAFYGPELLDFNGCYEHTETLHVP